MEPLNVKIILGSTREGRFSDRVGAWMLDEAKRHEGITAELLDLRDYEMPFFNEPVSTSYKQEPFKNEAVQRWTAKIAEGDAFIVIAPEYNHGYPAVLKNALDYVYQEWNNKAIGFVSYGSAMGARSVEQLRQVAIELQLAPVRNSVHMTYDVLMAIGKGTDPKEALASYADRAKGLVEQVAWWGRALKTARKQ